MFRLRFNCPFCEQGHHVFWIGIVLVSLSVLITVFNDGNIFAAVIIPAFTVLVGGYIWANRITEFDKRNIDKADLPLWRPLTDDEREKLIEKNSCSIIIYIIIFAAVAIFMIVLPRNSTSGSVFFKDRFTMNIGVATLIAVAVVMLIDYISSLRWKNIDDTAICTEVPVHLHFSVEHYSRGSRWTNHYIVIYLPDGKYVLRSNLARSQTVKLVRYSGMLTYFEDDVDDDVLMWKE